MTAPDIDLALETPAHHLSVDKMPAHWLMARLGKRVLRPGGLETTRWLIEHARITSDDALVELAPGMGLTAERLLEQHPASYVAVERDLDAAALVRRVLASSGHPNARLVQGDAAAMPLEDASASLIFGEAMLSMQTLPKKKRILAEARRVLRAGGRYAIHELAVVPEDIDEARLAAIARDLSDSIHVGVRIGTLAEWRSWFEEAGFTVESTYRAPMRLLELDRLVADEGVLGTARFIVNAVRTPGAVKRLRSVRASFRKHMAHLGAIALVARAQA